MLVSVPYVDEVPKEKNANLLKVSPSNMDFHGGLRRRLKEMSTGLLLQELPNKLDIGACW